MPRKINHIEGQTSFFDEGFSTSASKGEAPITYGPEGSYVDVAQRAALLDSSLIALGKRNQRLGFDVASHTHPYSSPIWGRYEELTPTVIEGAQRNVYNYLDVAKRDFWAATGFTAMRGLGLMSNAEIDARGRKMWRDFTHAYGDPKVREQRDKYKKQLRKVIRNSEKLAA